MKMRIYGTGGTASEQGREEKMKKNQRKTASLRLRALNVQTCCCLNTDTVALPLVITLTVCASSSLFYSFFVLHLLQHKHPALQLEDFFSILFCGMRAQRGRLARRKFFISAKVKVNDSNSKNGRLKEYHLVWLVWLGFDLGTRSVKRSRNSLCASTRYSRIMMSF